MTALDIHETELEELLIYDDLFLEYFNAFLALPAFPVRIFYDRLTGNVCDLDGTSQDDPDVYGASDLQRETTFFWLRQERLPLFRKSLLYTEYKLTKLLVRPLEDPQPASRYGIRGYSRQTNSVALSTSHGSTGPQQFSAPSVWPEELLVTEGRFPSRVHSTPAAPGYDSDPYRLSVLQQYGDAIMRLCQPLDPQVVDGDLYAAVTHSETTGPSFQESPDLHLCTESSARAEDQKDTRDEGTGWTDTEDLYSLTEEEENFVKQHNLTMSSLQQLKEEALSSRAGLGRFLHFLQDTQGIHIFRFWMDCEAFKEQSVELEVNHSPEDARHLCVHLFRNIQNKYQHHLSPECQEQIRLCQQSRGPSYDALSRSQYDALRRLRSYWIPRFLIHQQRRSLVSLTEHAGVKPDSASLDAAIYSSIVTDQSTDDRSANPRMRDSDTIFRPLAGPKSSLSDRMISALKNDAQAGGTFLHYLNRFETPKTTQIFLLWQELNEYGEWGTEQKHSAPCQNEAPGQGPAVYSQSSIAHAGDSCLHCENGDPVMGRLDLSEGIQLADLGSTYHLALAAVRDPWIRFLKYDITMFLRYCVPLSHKSHELRSEGSKERKTKPRRSYKDNGEKGLDIGGSKKVKKRKDPLMVPGLTTGPGHLDQDPNIPLELLQHKAIYKAYKKLIQDTEEPQTVRILEMLHALQCNKEEHKVLRLIQKVLELDTIQNPQLQGLRKHLANEISKGVIKSSSIEQVTRFLGMLLAASFNRFWGEMFSRLKEYGVEQSENEDWTRLEPILLALSTKIAAKRLHGRRNATYHPAQLLPSVDDRDSFHQALEMAAQGWPTPEVLHFLKYLQTHGPSEGLPLLENNLLCYLELRKYKNAHHAMPDCGLLKKKVHVIKERFLLLRENSGLQLSPEHMEATLRDTKMAEAAHSDLPSISLFDHLHDLLSDSLLPFWAGFRKAWAARSPASAQRVPLLRVQQMLRKRLALFEVEEMPLRTFHLPPVQQNFNKAAPSMVTFSFSMTNGLTLKENRTETTDSPASRITSLAGDLPPLSPSSPERTPLEVTSVAKVKDDDEE